MALSELTGAHLPSNRVKGGLILVLAGIAGFVDAVGFLNLAHLFTSHMSGNSAAAGAYLGQGDWSSILHRIVPVPIFVLGVMAGAYLTEREAASHKRSVFWLPLALEAVLLALYLAAGDQEHPIRTTRQMIALATLPSFAMGIQSATLRRVGHRSVRTTYVTGMLTDFAEGMVDYLFWRAERAGSTADEDHSFKPTKSSLPEALLCGAIWLVFVAGAGFGSLINTYWSFNALVIPIAGLLIVLAWDLIQPLYIKPS